MKKVITLFLLAAAICLTGCKANLINNEPEPETPAPTPGPAPTYILKTGQEINTIFENMGAKNEAVAFKPSSLPPAKTNTVYYLDEQKKNVLVWYDTNSKIVYYYADGITTAGADKQIIVGSDASKMFKDCIKMKEIDISVFSTPDVENMAEMFLNCYELETLVFGPYWWTMSVIDIRSMFQNCANLKELDIYGWPLYLCEYADHMFSGCISLETLKFPYRFCSKNSFNSLFYNCQALKDLDVSWLFSDEVTDMSYMFYNCKNITTLDFPRCSSNTLTSVTSMFEGCSKLESIYVYKDFEMTPAIEGENMFAGCTSLKTRTGTVFSAEHTDVSYAHIDQGSLNPGYFMDIENQSYELKTGAEINEILGQIGEKWRIKTITKSNIYYWSLPKDASIYYIDVEEKNVAIWCENDDYYKERVYLYAKGVTDGKGKLILNADSSQMFKDCTCLLYMDILSLFDTSNVENMSEMFSNCGCNCWGGCDLLFDLSSWDTSKTTDMSDMFSNCYLKELNISSWNTGSVTNMKSMFSGCELLSGLDLSSFNTSKVIDMSYMFYDCGNLQSLNLSNFNTSEVTDMSYMFYDCVNLQSLSLASFDTGKVINMSGMFYRCSKLKSLDISDFDTSNVTSMPWMICDCEALETLYFSDDVSSVLECAQMFAGCCNLKNIYVSSSFSGFTALNEAVDMFVCCTSLVGGAGTTYEEWHVDSSYAHIDGGTSNPGYFTLKQ